MTFPLRQWPKRKSVRDLTGRRFDSLVVVRMGGMAQSRYWWVQCDCGGPEFLRAELTLLSKKRVSPHCCEACRKQRKAG
jgi:hypothetical protein